MPVRSSEARKRHPREKCSSGRGSGDHRQGLHPEPPQPQLGISLVPRSGTMGLSHPSASCGASCRPPLGPLQRCLGTHGHQLAHATALAAGTRHSPSPPPRSIPRGWPGIATSPRDLCLTMNCLSKVFSQGKGGWEQPLVPTPQNLRAPPWGQGRGNRTRLPGAIQGWYLQGSRAMN